MDINIFHSKLSILYGGYNQTIKVLIADIETKYQRFPDSIFNEIRAFNDHIARCYIKDYPDEKIEKELEKAEGHIIRITLDCYKYLDAWLYDYFKEFKADFDISLIDNGEFAPRYYNEQAKGARKIREAKQNESLNKQIALDKYQEAYNIYSDLYENIENNLPKIQWAKKMRKKAFLQSVRFWMASTFVALILSPIIPWRKIINWISSIF